jgi:hypothetical protein
MLGVSLLETGEIDAAKEVSVFCDLSCCSWPDIVQAFQSSHHLDHHHHRRTYIVRSELEVDSTALSDCC